MLVEALRRDHYRVSDSDGIMELFAREADGVLEIAAEGRLTRARLQVDTPLVFLAIGEDRYAFSVAKEIETTSRKNATSGSGAVLSPMPGVVADLRVAVGDAVTAGQVVATIESMKLLIPLEAGVAGTVSEVSCVAGDSVTAGSPILLIRTTS